MHSSARLRSPTAIHLVEASTTDSDRPSTFPGAHGASLSPAPRRVTALVAASWSPSSVSTSPDARSARSRVHHHRSGRPPPDTALLSPANRSDERQKVEMPHSQVCNARATPVVWPARRSLRVRRLCLRRAFRNPCGSLARKDGRPRPSPGPHPIVHALQPHATARRCGRRPLRRVVASASTSSSAHMLRTMSACAAPARRRAAARRLGCDSRRDRVN